MQPRVRIHGVLALNGLLLLLFALALSSVASALPSANSHALAVGRLVKHYSGAPSGKVGTGGPATSDYPTDEEIRNSFHNGTNSPFVFFSQIVDSTPAYYFAQSKGGAIFRQAYPPKYTTQQKRSKAWFQDFADRFSGIFAERASGDVYFVTKINHTVPDCRVWSRIATLTQNPNVESVILVDYTNFTNQRVIWTQPTSNITERGLRGIAARAAAAKTLWKPNDTYCLDWDGDGDDPADADADADADDDSASDARGRCGVHITQYQKHKGPPGNDMCHYRFDVYLYDAHGKQIGGTKLLSVPGGSTRSVNSVLPHTFHVTAGNVDDDAVFMTYANQSWGSNDQEHHCTFGSYDCGNRDGDCGFAC